MTIQEVYTKYKIMPTLQQHQLRVAAVGKIICDSIPNFADTKEVITTCLLHDMGNILKFDLNYFPEFLQPEGLEYWQQVKDEYLQKYGPDEHHATAAIIKELITSEKVVEYANQVGFSKLQQTQQDESLAKKICAYSDMRVSPFGITSTQKRLADGRKRYEGRKDKAVGSAKFDVLADALQEVEKQIQEKSQIPLSEITDEQVAGIVEELKNYEI